jgi:hypothetical protein
MDVQPQDRQVVLWEYRRLRRGHAFSPIDAMTIVRDTYAAAVCHAQACGWAGDQVSLARWAAAFAYIESMIGRPAWWYVP